MAKKGLGKGLGAIFGEDVVKENKEETEEWYDYARDSIVD